MNNDNQPTGQQLTPEEILMKCNVPDEHNHRAIADIKLAMNQYAAQQTALVQEKLTIAISLLQGFPIAEPGDFSIGGKHHEWYCRRCDFLENNGVLGTGVIKQTNEKDARIMELEGLLSGAQNIYTSAIKGRSDFRKAYVETLRSLKDKDTRIAELEKSRDMYMRECSKHLNAIISLKRVTDEAVKLLGNELPVIISILEEAQGVADFQGTASHDTEPEAKAWELKWKGCVERLRTGISSLSSGETKVDDINVADLPVTQQEQGEAKPECKMCNGKLMVGHMTTEGGETWPCPECFDNPSNNSSSSTQSPWISVEDRLPEIPDNLPDWSAKVTVIGAWGNKIENIASVTYQRDKVRGKNIFRFHYNGRLSPWGITHWMPIPEPPKSLTDKK